MKIGMVIAIPEEINALLSNCGESKVIEETGFTVYYYKINDDEVYAVGSGAGEISSAASTQYLITKFGVEMIVNFGVCGGLTKEMGVTRTAIVEKVVHYDFDAGSFSNPAGSDSVGKYMMYPDIYIPATKELIDMATQIEPTLKRVICASADKFIETEEEKAELHNHFNADICEMESAGIVLTANRNKIPVMLFKGVSDSVSGGSEEFRNMVHESAQICVKIMLKVLNMMEK